MDHSVCIGQYFSLAVQMHCLHAGSEMTGDIQPSRKGRRGPAKNEEPEPAGVFFDDDTGAQSGANTRTR
jgi:hypothetical protein